MRQMQVREAKGKFSEMIDAAAGGEPTTITRHGKRVAMLVSIEEGEKLYPPETKPKKSLIELLKEFPGGIDFESLRDHRPPREIDL